MLSSGAGAVALLVVAKVMAGAYTSQELKTVALAGSIAVLGATGPAIWLQVAHRNVKDDINQARHAAKHDALTGLINRAELYRELEVSLVQAAKDQTVVGVLFLDLNRFKIINDTLGHEAGDELLRVIASRLKATIRSTDVVARLGGDEFVVVCRDLLVVDSVINVASQVKRRFKEPVSLGGSMHEVGASIGIAIAGPGDERGPEDLLRDADSAMYKAKRERVAYVVFDDNHRSQLLDRAAVERDLARAVEEEQFVVFYQPIVDVVGWKLAGFEALLRWRHPERGLVEPRDFLMIADNVGLMSRIGKLVLRETCAQMAVWNHLSPAARDLTVSVNLAEQQLTDPNLAIEMEELLAWSGLDPSQIMVEVSENLIAGHVEELDSLRQIRELGVRVAIDSYGTGRSSFSYIRSFDMVSSLKIDRSFVRELTHDRAAERTVEAMVAMAGPLELSVVVEGVEEIEQMERLRSMGVRLMQGYLFNAPAYAEVIDPGAWFGDWSTHQEAALGLLPVNRR